MPRPLSPQDLPPVPFPWWPVLRAVGATILAVVVFACAAAVLFGLAGCGQPVHLDLVVFDDRTPESPTEPIAATDEVLDACDVLGFECRSTVYQPTGAIELHLVPDGMRRGRLTGRRPCWASVIVRASDYIAIAHELGHAFGLNAGPHDEHDPRPRNLMHAAAHDTELDDEQRDHIEASARALRACL